LLTFRSRISKKDQVLSLVGASGPQTKEPIYLSGQKQSLTNPNLVTRSR